MMTGAGFRLGGAIMMATGAVVGAVAQTAAGHGPVRDHIHVGSVGLALGLLIVGAVGLALGVIRSWLAGTMIYVHGRPRDAGRRQRPWHPNRDQAKPDQEQDRSLAELIDMAEFFNLGQEIERRRHEPPEPPGPSEPS